MRLKFSLRTLFLTTAIVAVACYWLILATINAQRFVGAVASENYELADTCFREPDDRFLFDWNEKRWRFKAEAWLEPWSFREFMRGERLVRLQVIYGDAGPLRRREWAVTATRAGFPRPKPVMLSRGFGGGGGIDTPLIHTAPTS